MSNEEIVKSYFEAWSNEDASQLKLTENFCHYSPNSTFNGRKDFMENCWGKVPSGTYEIHRITSVGDSVCVEYTGYYQGAEKGMPLCEWHRIKNGEIEEIRVYFGSTV